MVKESYQVQENNTVRNTAIYLGRKTDYIDKFKSIKKCNRNGTNEIEFNIWSLNWYKENDSWKEQIKNERHIHTHKFRTNLAEIKIQYIISIIKTCAPDTQVDK